MHSEFISFCKMLRLHHEYMLRIQWFMMVKHQTDKSEKLSRPLQKRCPCGQEHKLYIILGGIPEKWCRQDLVAGASKDQEGTSSGIIIPQHIFISICMLTLGGCSAFVCCGGCVLHRLGEGSGERVPLFWTRALLYPGHDLVGTVHRMLHGFWG
uniref:Uncharacterized protein n=1 Tax=mine drainage metagenome TaxID=410659 RepID=E6QDQ0_9ZZZZ